MKRKRNKKEFKCSCCGETEVVFLTLEYSKRDGAEHRKKHLTSAGQLADLRRRGWPKDGSYTILCFNCNSAFWERGICPHQKT